MKSSYFYLSLVLSLLISCGQVTEKEESQALITEASNGFVLEKNPYGVEFIEAYVSFVSKSFIANSETNLSYELTMLNHHRQSFRLKSIEVYSTENSNTPIEVFDENYLSKHVERPGTRDRDDVLRLLPNEYAIANIWLSVDESKNQISAIYHRLLFEVVNKNGEAKSVPMEVALIDFPEKNSLILELPFDKGIWFYMANSHRDTRYLTEGKSSYPQRYAIDWALLEEDGTFVKDGKGITSFPTYGVDILAVADGKVLHIQDSIPDNDPNSDETAVRITRQTICGNCIVLDIGNNISAVYAHLIPGSLQVKVGDKVKSGQVIGRLGNSGASTGPHLHFHLETQNKIPLGGQGLPYHFKRFTQLSSFEDEVIDTLFLGTKIQLTNLDPIVRLNEMPIGNGIIRFE